jgi:lipopolysaccharide export system protein LptA
MRTTATTLALIALLALAPVAALATDSDRGQPIVIDADEVEMDFRTGLRTYRGNVRVTQGSLNITGDRLVLHYLDDELEKSLVYGQSGRPATFRQRPQGADEDVYGEGRTIEMNEITNTLILTTDAVLIQGDATARGDTIVYDLVNERLVIRGGAQQVSGTENGDTATTDAPAAGRSRVVIQPQSGTTQ